MPVYVVSRPRRDRRLPADRWDTPTDTQAASPASAIATVMTSPGQLTGDRDPVSVPAARVTADPRPGLMTGPIAELEAGAAGDGWIVGNRSATLAGDPGTVPRWPRPATPDSGRLSSGAR